MKKILLGAVLVGLLAAPAVFAETERGFVTSTATANKKSTAEARLPHAV